MAHPQRQPIPYARDHTRTIEIVADPAREPQVINIVDDAKQLQELARVSPARQFRRLFFVWLRIYVRENKHGKTERVNVKIPLPIPIIGAAFARELSLQKAAKLAAELRRGRADALDELLESEMGFEFVRVHEEHPERDKSELVVIGLD